MNALDSDQQQIEASLQRVREGEAEAFEAIVRRFERPLRAWLATQAVPEIDVDEVAQQSFVTAYLRLADYQSGTNFAAWLFAIARYQLKTEITRSRRIADYRSRCASDLLAKELERQLDEPPEFLVARLEHLKQCVESLGASLFRFLAWRYQEEISLEEMAQRSGRSVAAVKKQLWVLRQKLKECIEARIAAANQ